MTAPPARPRPRARWLTPEPADAAGIAALAAELSLPPVVCELLWRRGLTAGDDAKRFLRPRLDQLHPPEELLDLDRAVDRLARAVRDGELVLVHGDYDVDGICSTTLLTRTLRALGGRVVPFIPRRLEDGYDLGAAGVRAAREAGARVVVTCDCGTSARGAVSDLVAAGVDVIVSDHHLPGGPLPDCLAVLNPKRPGCGYPDKDLAAVGVAFKLALALTRRLGGNENLVLCQLDLVALATIADIAPLRGENRVLVRYGLKLLNETRNVGLRALVRAAALDGRPLTAGRVGFMLAPRLNAVGRLGHALRGVQLLLSDDEHEANAIARELEELNRRRQELDRATLAEARAMVARLDLDDTFGIVLASERWHPGVIGIVASRIVEETGRPTLLIALENGEGKGSGRSISAFDLHGGLGACRDLLVRFGGHRAAAGITIAAERVEAFAARFNAVARERLRPEDLVPELRVDLELPLDGASEELETLLRHFEPFGIGNAAPLLVSRGVQLAGAPRVVGQDALKLRLATAAGELEAIGWGLGRLAGELDATLPVDVAYRLERDEYRGESRLVAKLVDVVQA
ncbi:MAG TPA: single-stranded-DNA-specific exonuclease RecJ [Gemmatimonadaceae bacterium]|nr:single-stranded-DNA-specific exonuclease RecJ [Gemmatimonadaceae bacterium]